MRSILLNGFRARSWVAGDFEAAHYALAHTRPVVFVLFGEVAVPDDQMPSNEYRAIGMIIQDVLLTRFCHVPSDRYASDTTERVYPSLSDRANWYSDEELWPEELWPEVPSSEELWPEVL